jgi:uncharacterized protein
MFNWFQRLLPKTGDFFGMFEAHAATLVGAAAALSQVAADGGDRNAQIQLIHDREHEADDIIRNVLRTVRKTFLTPFDRGAITALIAAMDDSIDEVQATARAIEVYDFDRFTPEMTQMVEIIVKASGLLSDAMPLLRNVGKNGAEMHRITEQVVRLEGEADVVHAAGLKRAYQENRDTSPIKFAVAREIYKHLERITDALEDVANQIDGIIIDHA